MPGEFYSEHDDDSVSITIPSLVVGAFWTILFLGIIVFILPNYIANWRASHLCKNDALQYAVFTNTIPIAQNKSDAEIRGIKQVKAEAEYEARCVTKYGTFPFIKITKQDPYISI